MGIFLLFTKGLKFGINRQPWLLWKLRTVWFKILFCKYKLNGLPFQSALRWRPLKQYKRYHSHLHDGFLLPLQFAVQDHGEKFLCGHIPCWNRLAYPYGIWMPFLLWKERHRWHEKWNSKPGCLHHGTGRHQNAPFCKVGKLVFIFSIRLKLQTINKILLEFPQFYPHPPDFISNVMNTFQNLKRNLSLTSLMAC